MDEAIPDVDKAIDDALLAGMDRFRLVHGKGTGMLRYGEGLARNTSSSIPM